MFLVTQFWNLQVIKCEATQGIKCVLIKKKCWLGFYIKKSAD